MICCSIKMTTYTDDTVMVCSDKDIECTINMSESVLSHVQEWCALNNIRVDRTKTRHMLTGLCKKGERVCKKGNHIKRDMNVITTVENFIYLGVNKDKNLNFEKFIISKFGTISRVQGRLITLARIRKLLDNNTSLAIYQQTIVPISEY